MARLAIVAIVGILAQHEDDLRRLAIVAIVAILVQQEDDLRMDAVDFEAGWDWMELIAAGLHGIVRPIRLNKALYGLIRPCEAF